jgi:predicted Zn-dependent protease
LAAKLKGYIWDIQGSVLTVEGVDVRLGPSTRIERSNHPGIVASDLRIGWEVEVELESEQEVPTARKVKVKNERFDDVKIDGYVVEIHPEYLEVDGRTVYLGELDEEVVPGMRLKGKGTLLEDSTIRLEKYELKPRRLEGGERDFLALATEELAKLKENLEFYEDRLFQEYVNGVGHRLAPDWVDGDVVQFNFSIVDDPDLNAFAMPDGTVVIHTGLLAVLENEAQLAAVLGHEIAHVTHKHSYRGYKRAQKMQWLALGAAVAGAAIDASADRNPWKGPSLGRTLFEVGAALSLSAAMNGHGRNLEDDADRIGLHYALDAGYDPYQAPEVWRIFDQHISDQNTVANWLFSDHSTHRARISNLTRELNLNYRGKVDPSSLTRNEQEYARMVRELRRHNAIQDYERKEFKNAEEAFRRLLEENPDDAVAHLYLGNIRRDTGRLEAALQEYRTAIQLDPDFPDPYRETGFLYYGQGNYRRAVEAFQTYLEMAPQAADAAEIRDYVRRIHR